MQISSVVGSAISQSTSTTRELSATQRTNLDKILEKYDGANFTAEDFAELGSELKSAGIRPSAEVKSAIEAKGINIDQYVSASGQTPPPPPQTSGTTGTSSNSSSEEGGLLDQLLSSLESDDEASTSLNSAIYDFVQKYRTGSVEESDISQLVSALDSANVPPNGLLVNKKA
ncbi:MAG: hypothetical protein ACK5ZH_02960 [Alphaproteobacteria bacterium]